MFGRIVDLGCGDGGMFNETPFAPNTVGVDMGVYRTKYKQFVQTDAASTPFKDGEFEVAFLGELLQQVPDPVKVLKEAKRICKGPLVFTVPYEYNWSENLLPFTNPASCRSYTLDMLCGDFDKAGLSYQVEMLSYDGWCFLVGCLK
jgi:SAM-dependent methyltransferase